MPDEHSGAVSMPLDLGLPVATAVVPTDADVRFDRFATQALSKWLPSRNRARKAAKAGLLRLDGEVVETSRFVKPGQRITLHADRTALPPELQIDLEVVFEDDQIAIVIKPPGLITSGNRIVTLQNALPGQVRSSTAPDALPAARPVHRLDRATGGLVACAKTHSAQVWLGHAFEARTVTKRYRAIVIGRLEGQREIHDPIDGREAHSTLVPVAHTRSLHTGWTTTLDLFPHTGRTHQLRRHCADLGHPILGDTTYGKDGPLLRGKGLYLWALELRVPGPDGDLAWSIDEPAKFQRYRERETRRWRRWYGDQDGPGDAFYAERLPEPLPRGSAHPDGLPGPRSS